MKNLQKKQDALIAALQKFDSLTVAFSGGVDSTLLLSVAQEVLGDRVVAVTSSSTVHPRREVEDAVEIASKMGIRHIIIATEEMTLSEFTANHPNRCYVCKQHLFKIIKQKSNELGIKNICHGANVDDFGDIRPGFAAAQEHGIHAPLINAELTKEEIRQLSKKMNLPNWNKPAMACLATRIPFGIPISEDMLRMIESAETILHNAGFLGCRVRHHGDTARIEALQEDFMKLIQPNTRTEIISALKKIGFIYIAMDLEGYTQGSMNRKITEEI